LPAIAIPAAAAQCVLQGDAELLALGAQLEPFLQRWIAQNRDDFARVKRGEVGHDEERTVEEWQRGDKERNEVCDALYSLADEILSLTATTKEGLAVQLRAITATDAELWDNKTWGAAIPRYYHDHGPSEADRYLAFFESACAVLGVVPVSIEAMMEGQLDSARRATMTGKSNPPSDETPKAMRPPAWQCTGGLDLSGECATSYPSSSGLGEIAFTP
jgi:hypothetical protein